MIDTAPLVKKSVSREPRTIARSAQNRARYLVAEYLHDWGLRDPDIIAGESRRIVEQAERLLQEQAGDAPERDLGAMAIRITMDEVEAAIARMAATSPAPAGGVPTNNSILPRLAPVLLEFPEAIRHRDRSPARLLQVLERSLSPICPCSHHREMRAQPRTKLWRVLRKGYWRTCQRRLQEWTRRLMELGK